MNAMNAMCLGTQQRQFVGRDPRHGFHPFDIVRAYCRARLRSWTSVFAEMMWVGLLFLCPTAPFLRATRHGPVYPVSLPLRLQREPHPDGHREESV